MFEDGIMRMRVFALLVELHTINEKTLQKIAEEIDRVSEFSQLVILATEDGAWSIHIKNRAGNVFRYMCEHAYGDLLALAGNGRNRDAMILARAILHVMSECKKFPSQDPLFVHRSPYD